MNGVRARCARCGAPSSRSPGGRLLPLTGFTGKIARSRRPGRTRPHRDPRGYEHADPAFCRRRLPHVGRRPLNPRMWGERDGEA